MENLLELCLMAGVLGLMMFRISDTAGQIWIPNRLATAKVGEWVLYKIPDSFTQKHMIIDRIGHGPNAYLTIKIDTLKGRKIVNSREGCIMAGGPIDTIPYLKTEDRTIKLRYESATVKDKKIMLTTMEIIAQHGQLLQAWHMTNDLPVYGLFKLTDSDQKKNIELIDFEE